MTVHVTFPLEEALKAELERLASLENISVEAFVARLVQQQLEDRRMLIAQIQEGIDSAENEPLTDHDEVFAALRARLAAE